ncbi:hypothetical protein DFS34DRAFT_639634 [Phlyctochytrium arcticum]|nr:hypothetical protein DFS34DRAFT_639634 [Phlyctochytrium arcticum]
MTYNAVKPPDSLTGGSASAPAFDFKAAIEKARAQAAKLGALTAATANPSGSGGDSQATKRSHGEVDDYRPPSSGYRRDDFDQNNKRHAGDGAYGAPSSRPHYGLGHSDASSSHYGPSGGGGGGGGGSMVVSGGLGGGRTQETITVPTRRVGKVIGTKGANLKTIISQCNVGIQIEEGSPSDPERRVNIEGTSDNIKLAKSMIYELLADTGPMDMGGGMGRPSSGPYGGDSEVKIIPTDKVGWVIGKRGENIHSLQERSGARIKVEQFDSAPGIRPVNISGAPNAVALAKQLIDEVLSQPSREMNGPSATIQVQNDKVGLVIGKGGSTIKHIQMTCGVFVKADPVEMATPDGFRNVYISRGNQQQIDMARDMIMDLISDQGGRRDSSTSQYGGYNNQQQQGQGYGYGGYNQWGGQGASQDPAAYGQQQQQQQWDGQQQQWDPNAYGQQQQQQGYENQQYDPEAWNAYYQYYYSQGYGPDGQPLAAVPGAEGAAPPPGMEAPPPGTDAAAVVPPGVVTEAPGTETSAAATSTPAPPAAATPAEDSTSAPPPPATTTDDAAAQAPPSPSGGETVPAAASKE